MCSSSSDYKSSYKRSILKCRLLTRFLTSFSLSLSFIFFYLFKSTNSAIFPKSSNCYFVSPIGFTFSPTKPIDASISTIIHRQLAIHHNSFLFGRSRLVSGYFRAILSLLVIYFNQCKDLTFGCFESKHRSPQFYVVVENLSNTCIWFNNCVCVWLVRSNMAANRLRSKFESPGYVREVANDHKRHLCFFNCNWFAFECRLANHANLRQQKKPTIGSVFRRCRQQFRYFLSKLAHELSLAISLFFLFSVVSFSSFFWQRDLIQLTFLLFPFNQFLKFILFEHHFCSAAARSRRTPNDPFRRSRSWLHVFAAWKN